MPDDERGITEEFKEPATEAEIMEQMKQWRTTGINGSQNRYERMRKSEDFAIGINQWDAGVAEANRLKGKFSLTIPIVGPQVNSVTGSHIQNSQDFKVTPLRDGSIKIAQLLTALAKHATDSEHYTFQEKEQFKSGVTSMEGDLLFSLDWAEDPKHANLMVEKLDEQEVMWDPVCNTYDPNQREGGANYVYWEPWRDKNLINQRYPDKREELAAQGSGGPGGIVMGAINRIISWMSGSNSGTESTWGIFDRGDVEVRSKYRYKMTHCWWRWPRKAIMFYDNEGSELDARLLIEPKDIKEAKDIAKQSDRFEAIDVIKYIMHHTIYSGDVFLEDKVDELKGCQLYPISRYHAYYDNGYASGIAEKLIGTQEMINFSYSAEVNILKKMPNSGWIIGGDPSNEYTKHLEDYSGEDGFVADREKAGGFIEQIQPNIPSGGFANLTERGIEHAKQVTGIRTEDPTTDKDRVATTVALKQQAAARDQAIIHSNWNYTQSIAGNLLIEIIRYNEIYSEDEIREIVNEDDLIGKQYMDNARQVATQLLEEQGVNIPDAPQPPDIENMQNVAPEVQQAAIQQYQEDVALMQQIARQIDQIAAPIAQQMLIDDIRDMKRGKYNTKVTLSPSTITARVERQLEMEGTNKMLLENGQVPIGRRWILKNTSLDDKDEIIAEGEQQQQQLALART